VTEEPGGSVTRKVTGAAGPGQGGWLASISARGRRVVLLRAAAVGSLRTVVAGWGLAARRAGSGGGGGERF